MNLWLRREYEHSREQAAETRKQIDRLRDPRWLNEERARRDRAVTRAHIELDDRILDHERIAEPEAVAAEIGRLERDAERWDALAEGAADRLAQTEQPTLEEPS